MRLELQEGRAKMSTQLQNYKASVQTGFDPAIAITLSQPGVGQTFQTLTFVLKLEDIRALQDVLREAAEQLER